MPQLMPLMWGFSTFFIMVLLIVGSQVYGVFLNLEMLKNNKGETNVVKLWCW